MGKWFASHVVVAVHVRDAGGQAAFPVYENVLLVEAASPSEAKALALSMAKEQAHAQSDGFTWEGKAARLEALGVRKVIECDDSDLPPHHGTEVTYSMFLVVPACLHALLKGERVELTYFE